MNKNEINKLIGDVKFVFGNDDHIQIATLFTEIKLLEKSIKKNDERKVEIKEIDKKNKVLTKEIQEKEKRLMWLINKLKQK